MLENHEHLDDLNFFSPPRCRGRPNANTHATKSWVLSVGSHTRMRTQHESDVVCANIVRLGAEFEHTPAGVQCLNHSTSRGGGLTNTAVFPIAIHSASRPRPSAPSAWTGRHGCLANGCFANGCMASHPRAKLGVGEGGRGAFGATVRELWGTTWAPKDLNVPRTVLTVETTNGVEMIPVDKELITCGRGSLASRVQIDHL